MSACQYDLVIIGGGSAGLGAAYHATKKNLKTCLLEKGDLSQATSNNTLRIIHGGFRYLQDLNFSQALNSIKAQEELIKTFPHLIKPLPCLLPLKKLGLRSRYPVLFACKLYEIISWLAGAKEFARPVVLSRKDLPINIQLLNKYKAKYFLHWYDALLLKPNSLAKKIEKELIQSGVHIETQANFTNYKRNGSKFQIEYMKNGQTIEIKSKSIVSAQGPWIGGAQYSWAKAFNLVLNTNLEKNYAICLFDKENNSYFLVPRDNKTCVGTFYLPFSGSSGNLNLASDEILSALKKFNSTHPDFNFDLKDVISFDLGVIPVKTFKNERPVFLGQDRILGADNDFQVLTTKFTTFLRSGNEVINKIKI